MPMDADSAALAAANELLLAQTELLLEQQDQLIAANRKMQAQALELQRLYAEARRHNDELERLVRARTIELELANRAKSVFLAAMSHQLHTPLTTIIGYAELAMDELQERGLTTLARDAGRMLGAGRELLALVNDVLSITSLESGFRAEIDTTRGALLARELIEGVRPLAERHRTTVAFTIAPEAREITTDLARLARVLGSLLDNAAKFTHDGSILLAFSREQRGGHAWLVASVRDTGVGIAPERAHRLLQDASAPGGLGLAICRRLCVLLGGDIGVESAPGAGATFTVRLPWLEPAAAYAA